MARMKPEEIEERLKSIVDFVKQHQPCTVYELASYLNRTAWTARAWVRVAQARDPRLFYRAGVLYYREAEK